VQNLSYLSTSFPYLLVSKSKFTLDWFWYLARLSDSTYAIGSIFAFYEVAILQVCSGGLRRGVIRIRISKKNRQHNGQKKKALKDKQQSTKHTHKAKDRVTRIPLNIADELMCSGRVGSSCSISSSRRVKLITNWVISHEWGKDREVFMTSGTYPLSFVTQIFHNGQPSQGGDRTTSEVLISTGYY
jgi:hypothetical protein